MLCLFCACRCDFCVPCQEPSKAGRRRERVVLAARVWVCVIIFSFLYYEHLFLFLPLPVLCRGTPYFWQEAAAVAAARRKREREALTRTKYDQFYKKNGKRKK